MTDAAPLIVWFREDLRLSDNPALTHASESGRPVIALYILDETEGVRGPGAAARWWLNRSLTSLAESLRSELHGALQLRRGPALETLTSLIQETGATAVVWNRLYEPAALARDRRIKNALSAAGVECRSFNGALLNEPWKVARQDGGPFQVFTPYWRAADALVDRTSPLQTPRRIDWWLGEIGSDNLSHWRLHPTSPDWSEGFADWSPGEPGARQRLDAFVAESLPRYAEDRDRPSHPGTSRLSPHLHFGEISPRQVCAATAIAAAIDDFASGGAQVFRKELGWREFNHHILFHYPKITTRNFRPAFDLFPWREDPAGLEAWKRGLTGYPIVDAGMRELWRTGWMHNRVRMIVASFLTKHLLIDWRMGEAWFWDTLVDADPANNLANWQWVAGSGADAAPYFRIFNPILQGQKFDPDGDYVRRWAPELSRLPRAVIHAPWLADRALLRQCGVTLGVDYPKPIIDHALARQRALDAYRSLPPVAGASGRGSTDPLDIEA